MQKTLFDKLWRRHVIKDYGDGRALIYIDRNVVHESSSREAFDRLRADGLPVHRPELTFPVIDHSVATSAGRTADTFLPTRERIEVMRANCTEFGVQLIDVNDPRQGIAHVIAPELGITLPGTTLICGDSHTATNGALGCWAWGVGTTEVGQVLASQALVIRRPKTMRVTLAGVPGQGVYAKDIILYLIRTHGIDAGVGHAVEYCGEVVDNLSVEGRMTLCNMSIEFGAKSGLMAPDESTFSYIQGRLFAPKGLQWDQAVDDWRSLKTDQGATFDKEIRLDVGRAAPQISWGTSPQDVIGVDERIPEPGSFESPSRSAAASAALKYMGLTPGQPISDIEIDIAFIGSCTNARLSDLEEAANIVRGRRVAPGVRALVVPGSSTVKREAEALGIDKIFTAAGFEWRESGCSMCVASNGDAAGAGQRLISTTNRNFESRQGPSARTHLASPATVAASAITGSITDVRRFHLF